MNKLWTLLPLLALVAATTGTWLGERAATTADAAATSTATATPMVNNAVLQPPAARSFDPASADSTFVSVEITLDPEGQPLAAYQVELETSGVDFKVVGIVPSAVAAFPREPYYDLNASTRQTDRLILANYSVADADTLPTAPLRVATVNLALVGSYPADDLPPINLKLTACYGPDGKKIPAEASYKMSAPE